MTGRATTGRATGLGMSPRLRFKCMLQIRTIWAEDPTVTIGEMVRRTSAPVNLVQRIRIKLVEEGKLPRGNRR